MSSTTKDPKKTSWYKPGKSSHEFHQSDAQIRALIGGRGSGKTTTVSVEVIKHCWEVPGAVVFMARKTSISQADTTISTLNQVLAKHGNGYQVCPGSLFKSWNDGRQMRLPSKEAMDRLMTLQRSGASTKAIMDWIDSPEADKWCSWVRFDGLKDGQQAASKLRGMECTMLVLIEADQLDESDFALSQACLRLPDAFGHKPKRTLKPGEEVAEGDDPESWVADWRYKTIIDTNPPDPDHWIARFEAAAKADNREDVRFWHICTEENRQNLPENYIENSILLVYRDQPAMLDRMYRGKYARAYDGIPVLHAFKSQVHAIPPPGRDGKRSWRWPQGAYMVIGMDFGISGHGSVISAYFETSSNGESQEYWWDLAEYYREGETTEAQCVGTLDLIEKMFPFWNNRALCSGVIWAADPAGAARNAAGGKGHFDILKSYGISPRITRGASARLKSSLAVYNRLLAIRDKQGQPIYRINPDTCPKLYTASCGGYRYPKHGEPGWKPGDDPDPLKGPLYGNFDHIVDSARYGKMNCLRLPNNGNSLTGSLAGPLAHSITPNPVRQF